MSVHRGEVLSELKAGASFLIHLCPLNSDKVDGSLLCQVAASRVFMGMAASLRRATKGDAGDAQGVGFWVDVFATEPTSAKMSWRSPRAASPRRSWRSRSIGYSS